MPSQVARRVSAGFQTVPLPRKDFRHEFHELARIGNSQSVLIRAIRVFWVGFLTGERTGRLDSRRIRGIRVKKPPDLQDFRTFRTFRSLGANTFSALLLTMAQKLKNMARTGKIARLPLWIRDELNRCLSEGKKARSLVKWLNSEPKVRVVLDAEFAGRPIREQNLSDWRKGGYRDWLAQRLALEDGMELCARVGAVRVSRCR